MATEKIAGPSLGSRHAAARGQGEALGQAGGQGRPALGRGLCSKGMVRLCSTTSVGPGAQGISLAVWYLALGGRTGAQ